MSYKVSINLRRFYSLRTSYIIHTACDLRYNGAIQTSNYSSGESDKDERDCIYDRRDRVPRRHQPCPVLFASRVVGCYGWFREAGPAARAATNFYRRAAEIQRLSLA